jgi:hypothetical protein
MSFRSGSGQSNISQNAPTTTYQQAMQLFSGELYQLPIRLPAGTYIAYVLNTFTTDNAGGNCTIFTQSYGIQNTNWAPDASTSTNYGAGLVVTAGDGMINSSSYVFELQVSTEVNLFQQYLFLGGIPSCNQIVSFTKVA